MGLEQADHFILWKFVKKEVMEIMARIERLKALEETGKLGAFILAIAVRTRRKQDIVHDLLLAIHQLLSI